MGQKILDFFEKIAPNLLGAIIVLVVGLIAIKLLMSILKKAFEKSKLDVICHKFILSLVKVVLYLLLLIMTLSMLKVDMTSLVAMLSVAGLAVSLAIQGSLSNVAGGFILLLSKPFKVGDFIEVGSVSGTVRNMNILKTTLITFDNKAIYIPNGQVSDAKIVNFSAQDTRRLDLTFSIGYNDDFKKAKSIILNIVETHSLALKEPAPLIRVCALDSSSVQIAVKVWVKTENYWDLNFDLLEMIKTAFDENNISIPFNQLDVNIKNPQ